MTRMLLTKLYVLFLTLRTFLMNGLVGDAYIDDVTCSCGQTCLRRALILDAQDRATIARVLTAACAFCQSRADPSRARKEAVPTPDPSRFPSAVSASSAVNQSEVDLVA